MTTYKQQQLELAFKRWKEVIPVSWEDDEWAKRDFSNFLGSTYNVISSFGIRVLEAKITNDRMMEILLSPHYYALMKAYYIQTNFCGNAKINFMHLKGRHPLRGN